MYKKLVAGAYLLYSLLNPFQCLSEDSKVSSLTLGKLKVQVEETNFKKKCNISIDNYLSAKGTVTKTDLADTAKIDEIKVGPLKVSNLTYKKTESNPSKDLSDPTRTIKANTKHTIEFNDIKVKLGNDTYSPTFYLDSSEIGRFYGVQIKIKEF